MSFRADRWIIKRDVSQLNRSNTETDEESATHTKNENSEYTGWGNYPEGHWDVTGGVLFYFKVCWVKFADVASKQIP